LGGRKGIRPVKIEWSGAGVLLCLERHAELHMAQLMPLPVTVSCFSKIHTGFTFLVPAHPGVPVKMAAKWVCVFLEKFNITPTHLVRIVILSHNQRQFSLQQQHLRCLR